MRVRTNIFPDVVLALLAASVTAPTTTADPELPDPDEIGVILK
jgi:hypothetical protein